MPRINLVYLRVDSQTLGTEVVHYERIKALLEIGATGRWRQDCLVDTGATLSVFPEKQWKSFQNDINWLYVPGSGGALPGWITKVPGWEPKLLTAASAQSGSTSLNYLLRRLLRRAPLKLRLLPNSLTTEGSIRRSS